MDIFRNSRGVRSITSIERKQELIQITQRVLEEEGLEGVKIRKIAEAAGCTSAVLYKYFSDLDQLVSIASVKFLEGYIAEFIKVRRDASLNPLESDIVLWKAFITEAFKYLPFYEILFFGKYSESLADTIFEYYLLFPDEIKEMDGFMVSIMFNGDLCEREYFSLRRAAGMGLMTHEDAKMLSRLNPMVFHGVLMEYKYDYKTPGVQEKAAKECFHLIWELTERFINQPLSKNLY